MPDPVGEFSARYPQMGSLEAVHRVGVGLCVSISRWLRDPAVGIEAATVACTVPILLIARETTCNKNDG